MKNTTLFLLAFLITLPVLAAIRGINKPDKTIKLGAQRCHVFKSFVVVEYVSTQKGAEKIAIRKITGNVSPKVACSSATLKNEVVLDISEEYVYGVRGDFLFTTGADGFGQEHLMRVYSISSPKALHSLNYHSEKDFIVTDIKNSLAIEFFSRLKLSCTLAGKSEDCWTRIKKENGISEEDVVKRPDCLEVYDGHSFKTSPELKNNPSAIQVFALAKIKDVKSKKIHFLKGQATCDASP